MLRSASAVDHAEPFDHDVACVFGIDQAMGPTFPGIAEAFGRVVGDVETAQQAGTVIEREGDVASKPNRADLEIAGGKANDTAPFGMAGVDRFLDRLGIHGDAVANGAVVLDIEDLGLCRLVGSSDQCLIVAAVQTRRSERDECYQQYAKCSLVHGCWARIQVCWLEVVHEELHRSFHDYLPGRADVSIHASPIVPGVLDDQDLDRRLEFARPSPACSRHA